MPELPEVETIVRELRHDIIGRTIVAVRFLNRSIWRRGAPAKKHLIGASISSLERRGKNILVTLSNGRVMIVHLKMTGRLTYQGPNDRIRKHTHLVIDLDSGQIRFNDTRRFGYLDLVAPEQLDTLDYLSILGPDALFISREDFVTMVRSKTRIIKSLLLDQSILAGMGNIYSD